MRRNSSIPQPAGQGRARRLRAVEAPVSIAGNEDRLLTLPNVITLVRLACVPLLLYLLVGRHPPLSYQAAALMAVLGCTDWVDGYLARHLHQVSTIGKVLDPVADRLLLICGIAGILYVGAVPTWVAVLALGRELLVAGATIILAAL